MAEIEVRGLRKSFQTVEVLHGIDLTIEDGAFTILVGPSGCGKSTLLRVIAGLEEVTSGEVHIDGERCDHLLPSARGMAMVFQSYALYPHMTVRQNLRFGLENLKTPKAEIDRRVRAASEILQIPHLMDRRPNQLSGGQGQRVAIGRAIVKEPKAFLLDEPLSNLDAELRVKMRSELVSLHRRLQATMVYVTHDQVEAMTMADRIVVMRDGIVEQSGPPIELYARPANRFVAGFIGAPQMNLFAAQVSDRTANGILVALDDDVRLELEGRGEVLQSGERCTVGIRPEHLEIREDGQLAATVRDTEVLGAETIVHGALASGVNVTFSVRGISGLRANDVVRLRLNDPFLHVFDSDGRTHHPLRDWAANYIVGNG